MANNTYGECPCCKKGQVVGSVSHEPLHGTLHMPMGPISEQNYRLIVSFWCSGCGIIFKFPPGNENAGAKLLAEERKRIAEVQKNW